MFKKEFNAKNLCEYTEARADECLRNRIDQSFIEIKNEICKNAEKGYFVYRRDLDPSTAGFICQHIIPKLQQLGFKAQMEQRQLRGPIVQEVEMAYPYILIVSWEKNLYAH